MPLFDIFWTMLWFFMWIAWIVLLIRIISDIFASSRSGLSKAGWSFFVLVLPLLGVLIYLVTQGDDMMKREEDTAIATQAVGEAYIRRVAGPAASPVS